MNTKTAIVGASVVVVAVVLLIVLSSGGSDEQQRQAPTEPARCRRSSSTSRASRSAESRISPTTRATRSTSRSRSRSTKRSTSTATTSRRRSRGRRHRHLRPPGRNRRRLRGRARGPQGTDRRADGRTRELSCPFAHALAARQDLPIPAWLFAWGASIVLIVSFFALSAAWRKPPLRGRALAPARRAASRGVLLGLPVQASAARSASSCSGSRSTPACDGTEAPDRNFALTFFFVTAWLGFPFFSAIFGDVFRPFNPWRAIGRAAGGGFRAIAGQRPAHLAIRSGSAAGRPRSACSPSSGWRSSTAPAAASRSASTRTPPPSPPSSTASTRWR